MRPAPGVVEGRTAPVLDAAAVRRWSADAAESLGRRRSELDALNVFPVADSDTGTNLFLTLTDAAGAVGALDPGEGTGAVVRAFTRGAVRGARGNSGVIVSQYLGVLCASLHGRELSLQAVAEALGRAADAARSTVTHPVEGTVLTVADALHDALAGVLEGAGPDLGAPDALEALDRAIDEGYGALARTTAQLPALRAAGVHDAGAWGLLLVVEAFARALGARAPAREPHPSIPAPVDDLAAAGSGRPAEGDQDADCGADAAVVTGSAAPAPCPHEVDEGGEFEVMYLVTTDDARDPAAELRTALDAIGGSVAVVGADGLWQAHVHTDDPCAAMAVPEGLGLVHEQVGVRHLPSQSGVHGARRPGLGLVTVTAARALAPDLARAGAVVVVTDEVPPAAALDRALDDTGGDRVLVLAAPRLGPVVHHGGAGGVRVDVLDDLSEVQVVVGAATLAAGDGGSADGLLAEVRGAVTGVRCAEVEPGPDDGAAVVATVVDLVDDATSLLTVLTAADTPEEAVIALREHLAGARPDVEVVVLPAGTVGRTLVLGAE